LIENSLSGKMNSNMLQNRQETNRIPRIWVLIGLTIAALILGDLNIRMAGARTLERDAAILRAEVSTLEAELASLEIQIQGANDEAAIIEWAHDQAKLVREGEVLVVPVPGEFGALEIISEPIADQTLPGNLDIWRELILGE
jgi:hypothetical protein